MATRVLIVDDDPITSSVVAAALATHGYTVSERNQSIGTRAAIVDFRPDVVVLDVDMPGMSGPALMRLLSSRSDRVAPSVIYHSAIEPAELQRLAHTTGALGAIPKGDMRRFLAHFELLMARRRQ